MKIFSNLKKEHCAADISKAPDSFYYPLPSKVFCGGRVQDWAKEPYIGIIFSSLLFIVIIIIFIIRRRLWKC